MALPFTFSSELHWSDNLDACHGPFESGGNLYAVLHDRTASNIEVWKSTDGGNSWAEQDSANHKTTSSTSGQRNVFAVQVGTTLYIAYLIASAVVNLVPFACATDTYGTAITGGPTCLTTTGGFALALSLSRRSDGSYVVVYSGSETVMGTAYRRCKYARYAPSAWVSGVAVSETGVQTHFNAQGGVLGASDRVHIFWHNATDTAFRHRTLTSANALQTIADVVATSAIGNYTGLGVLNGSEIVKPFVAVTTAKLSVARATSTDTPTWSTEVVSDATVTSGFANSAALAVDISTIYAFFVDLTSGHVYRDDDSGAGTWGTDTVFESVSCTGVSAGKITSAIGVLYSDNYTTVNYDAYSLAAAPTVFPPFPLRTIYQPAFR